MTTKAGDPRGTAAYKRQRAAMIAVWRAQDRKCWCRQRIDYGASPRDDNAPEVDHVHPVSTHPHLALVTSLWLASHRSCNGRRGNRPLPADDLGDPSRAW